ncbi:c-type cytochrome [Cuspidothrix issatschenkoi LEGE 03284]|uniref:cytochrome c6 PetJ n=1 Tax=Cuspidothrix issatschenkoi TaxID=230752 RepID=UPI00187E7B67|nr:c-type cytochrome [Cuspidothrix issatschenkoi]MBE9230408.1 c-type cytochrome [Cuspidothrix issatschenkoi LEGE 03284]
MKKIISVLLLGIAILTFAFSDMALAADGAALFSANCAQCHARGKNLVNPSKSLKKTDLEKYEMYSSEAIIAQITKGKGAMPAFGKKLKADEIQSIAAYVLEQAENGWNK